MKDAVRSRVTSATRRTVQAASYVALRSRPHRVTANPMLEELAAHRWILRALLDRLRINCVLDVGAHHGGFASVLRRSGYGGAIVSFEPVAASFEILTRRAAGDPLWHTHRLALGDAAGRATMHVAQASDFSSMMTANDFSLQYLPGSATASVEDVEVRRLDAVFDTLCAHVPEPRVLLKTDTQGWDLSVIEGARGCLDRVLALQAELSVRPLYEGQVPWLQVLQELERAGFRPVHFATVTREPSLGIIEYDYLASRG